MKVRQGHRGSLPVLAALLVAVANILASPPGPPAISQAMQVYKSGDYASAIPMLRETAATEDAGVQSALLSALTYQGQVEEAADLADKLGAKYPADPRVITARAELLFTMGEILAADKLFHEALHLNPNLARAHLGICRVLHASSFDRSARMSCMRANGLDPEDALITLNFMRYFVRDKLREEYQPFVSAHPWFFKDNERDFALLADIGRALAEQRAFESEAPKSEITIPLIDLTVGPNRLTGYGIHLLIGGKQLLLRFDTSVSGIGISEAVARRIGLKPVSAEQWGVGSFNVSTSPGALAAVCSIESLEYRHCVFRSLKPKDLDYEEDGEIGAAFFSDYLIHIDFKRRLFRLTPLPQREPDGRGYDRQPLQEEANYTAYYRYGSWMLLPMKLNGRSAGVFILSAGSRCSAIDSNSARLSTKLSLQGYTFDRESGRRTGKIFSAEKADLEFAHFQKPVPGIRSYNFSYRAGHREIRMTGMLGMEVLSLFRLDIDYRNGLVNFELNR